MHAPDPLPEAGGVPLDLCGDRLGGIAGEAGRDVCVRVDGVHTARRAGLVGEVLLADEDEGAGRHPAGHHVPLGGGDLGHGAAEVDRTGGA
ncbi:hypothetical protein GCM10017687_11940 [Streptomyces echinatus]